MDGILSGFLDYVLGVLDLSVDLGEQALYFDAVSNVVDGEDWFFGHGWYGISWIPAIRGSVVDRGVTFLGKPAGEIVREAYCGCCNPAAVPLIDGVVDEWKEFLIAEDLAGDSSSNRGVLLRVYATSDAKYFYYAVEIFDPIGRDESIVLELDLDEDDREDTAIHIWFTGSETWEEWSASLPVDMTYSQTLGYTDVQPSSDFRAFEGRVPMRMLGFPESIQLQVRFERLVPPIRYDEIEEWLAVP